MKRRTEPVGWLVDWLASWLGGWVVGWLVGLMVGLFAMLKYQLGDGTSEKRTSIFPADIEGQLN